MNISCNVFKSLHKCNTETYKIPNHLKEIIFEFFYLIATHKTFHVEIITI
jgi:hypothetical protein